MGVTDRKAVGTGRMIAEGGAGVGIASGIAMMIPDGTLSGQQMAGLSSILAVVVPVLLGLLRNLAAKKGWDIRFGTPLIVFLLVIPSVGCAGFGLGDFFKGVDDECIAGKLTADGATILNAATGAVQGVDWHDDYVRLHGQAKAGDRIFGAQCSERIKAGSGAIADAVDGDD